MDLRLIVTIIVAIAALAFVVRGAVSIKAGRREQAGKYMMLGASLLMLMTVILLLSQD